MPVLYTVVCRAVATSALAGPEASTSAVCSSVGAPPNAARPEQRQGRQQAEAGPPPEHVGQRRPGGDAGGHHIGEGRRGQGQQAPPGEPVGKCLTAETAELLEGESTDRYSTALASSPI
jgi:hypothetical protein